MKMWWTVIIFTLLIHYGACKVETFVKPENNFYTIVGIFDDSDRTKQLAFNESCSSAGQGERKLNATIIQPRRIDSYSVFRELCSTEFKPIAVFGPQSTIEDGAVRDQCTITQIPHLQAILQPFDPDLEVIITDEEGETDGDTISDAQTGDGNEGEEETEEENANEESLDAAEEEQEDGTEEKTSEIPVYKNITINFYPDPDEMAMAYAKLLQHYGWTKFAAFYEDHYGLLRIQKIIALHSTEYPIFIRKLDPSPDAKNHRIFKELKEYKADRILLDCNAVRIWDYMNLAKEMQVDDHYHHFVFVSLDASIHMTKLQNLKSNTTWFSMTNLIKLEEPQNVLASRIPLWDPNARSVTSFQHESLLLADMTSHLIEAVKAVEERLDISLKDGPPFPFCNSEGEVWEYGAVLQDEILKQVTTGVTGNVQFDENGKRSNYTLFVNEIHMKRRKIILKWNSTEPEELKPVHDGNLDSMIDTNVVDFRIISRRAEPYFEYKKCDENCTESEAEEKYEGFAVDLVKEIFKIMRDEFKLNYTYKFIHDEDKTYGVYNNKTKKWDGLIGDLLDKKADLAVCDLTITEERKTVVDFSVPFMSLGISILYVKENKVQPGTFSFMYPYDFEVWLYIAMAYLVVSIVLFVCARISPSDWENPQPCNKDPDELENIWNFKNCTWLTTGSIMTQGCDILPKGFGSRWVCSMWWFFAVIVCQTYIAQLSASMTSALAEEPINGVEDLANQDKILYGAINDGSTLSFFKNSKDKMYQTIYKNMMDKKAVLVASNDEGEKRVIRRNGKYAFFMESTTIEYKLKRDCRLKRVGGLLDSKDYGIAMPTNSPFRTDINRAILRLKERTVIDKIKATWWNPNVTDVTDCPAIEDENDVEGDLEMENLKGLFIVLIFGLFVCLLITAAEFMDEVRNIVVREQVTHKEAFIKELKASLNFFQLQKPVLRNPSRAPSVISDKSQLELKKERLAQALNTFMDLEKMEH